MRTISACRGQAFAYILRSPHAHARIDVAAAADAPGVLAILTGRDATADGLPPIPHSPVPSNPHEVPLQSRDGSRSSSHHTRRLTFASAALTGVAAFAVVSGEAAPLLPNKPTTDEIGACPPI